VAYAAADDATVAATTSPATWIARRGARAPTTGPIASVPAAVVVATTLACRTEAEPTKHLGVVPAGPKAGDQAEKVHIRLLHQVDQKRNARTRALVGQLLDRWLLVLDVDPTRDL
jgi:hypothetical protein